MRPGLLPHHNVLLALAAAWLASACDEVSNAPPHVCYGNDPCAMGSSLDGPTLAAGAGNAVAGTTAGMPSTGADAFGGAPAQVGPGDGVVGAGAGGSGGVDSGPGGAPAAGNGASAGSDATVGGSGGGGSGTDARVDGGAAPGADAGPSPPDYTLVVDTPNDGDVVSGSVTVRGKAPGFLNVEVWDATHQSPPLGQVAPGADGVFELTVDVSPLPSGQTSWTVHAWDSSPGQPFTNTASVMLQLQIEGDAAPPVAGDDGTPDPGTLYVPAGYHLAFSDEFDGTSLDTSTWNTLAPWGVQWFADSNQKQAFVPQAVGVGGGVATFTAERSNGSGTSGQPYSSGSITSNGTFTRGYFEARVKVPSGKGYWPAFWVTSSTRWPPEWDIFEIIDGVIYGYPHPIQSGLCQFVEGAAGGDSTYVIGDVHDTYHVYGFLWTATDLHWYVDGVLTEHWVVDAAAGANDPYWLNLSLQVGGDWPGDPDATTPFPGRMQVDYVRIYQR